MNPLRCATLTVADVDAAVGRFCDWLDYRMVERGRLAPDLAAAWRAPASAGRDMAVCAPASGAEVFVRFVAGDPVPAYRPIRTFGWAAIELCVADVLAVEARLRGSPFAVIGPPTRVAGLPTIFPMQVRGPEAETIYLTEITTDAPDSGLPRAVALVDSLFIAVLACADMAATAAWFAATLGVTLDPPATIRYSMINRAFDLAADSVHTLATARSGHDIFLEFDQYPAAATPRPQHAGQLPPGVALCSITHGEIDGIAGPWVTPPVAREGAVYGGRRTGILATPEGALIEIIEP